MPSYNVQAKFDSCELRFQLIQQGEIAPALAKKIKTMGFPSIWGTPSATKANTTSTGVIAIGDDSLDLSERMPISKPTEGGSFECIYYPEDNSIVVKLAGTFECWTTDNVKPLKNVACLYIGSISLQDAKGKDIKGPKDDYGIASPLEANITGSYREPGQTYQVPVTLALIKE
jgi:hypothetical protein